MSDDVPEQVTVCLRDGNQRFPTFVEETRECELCGHTVLVSPATVEEIERGVYPDYIVCVTCMNERQDDEQD